ncbi:MAG TPA: phage tail sheath subtilisin-like domain-containing protein [Blastococcus sp.]
MSAGPFPAPGVTRPLPGISQDVVLPEQRPAELPTGVCALLGVAGRGPRYAAVPLRRADEFAAVFGPPSDGSHLAAAVEGFFSCGGASCYAVRVDPADSDWLTRGLAALARLEDVDLVAVPDLAAAAPGRRLDLQKALLEDCERSGARFAVLDSLPGASAPDAIAQRDGLQSRFGALYFPWVRLSDGQVVPPSGHVAGAYAAGDAARGVGAAPANLELAGVFDLVPPPTPSELADLSAAAVNPLRSLPGRGIRVWGARTLAGPDQPEWTAIGVCRLFLSLARWLSATAPALTFEPNDLALWIRVRRQLTDRLWRLWREGSLAGATPDTAFYVRCDAGTNPPEVRDAGLVITEIGLAPSVPAEFVVVRLVQQDGRTTFA